MCLTYSSSPCRIGPFDATLDLLPRGAPAGRRIACVTTGATVFPVEPLLRELDP